MLNNDVLLLLKENNKNLKNIFRIKIKYLIEYTNKIITLLLLFSNAIIIII